MRAVAAAAVLASLAAATAASAEQAPIPLKAPTGYRDFCAAMEGGPRSRICPRGGVSQTLWRPLRLPSVEPDGACPVSPRRKIATFASGAGAGPVYPTHVEPWRVQFPPPDNSLAVGTGWAVDKTPLLLKRTFHGEFVIRGGRIDRPGELGFSGPGIPRPYQALQFAANRSALQAAGLDGWGILVWFQSAGCYALQIDGATFSRVVVFRVESTTG
jgi:hypothetical protein